VSNSTQSRSFRRHSSHPISWYSTEKTKSNTTKANIHREHKDTTTQDKHKKLNFGLVISCELQPRNGAVPILQLQGNKMGTLTSLILHFNHYCSSNRFYINTSHNRASRDCGSTVNTIIYPKGYAQSKCVSYIVTMRW